MVGINEQGEEEIPSCGRNRMVILKGVGGTPDVEAAVRAQTAAPLSSQ